MSYVTTLGGVKVEVSTQAARPREAPRPSPVASSKSPEMATRALRPREPVPAVKGVANAYLKQVEMARGKQKSLEALLKKLGNEMARVKGAINACKKAGGKCAVSGLGGLGATTTVVTIESLQAELVQIEKAAALCIEEIKKLAAKANAAADAAVATGASREAALKASAAGQQPTTAIETNSAAVTPSGTIVVGPDAKPADLSQEKLAPADVVVSTGTVGVGVGTLAVVGVVGFLGYRFAKKKGWV